MEIYAKDVPKYLIKMENNWTIADVWNSSIEKRDRDIEPRDHLWASEIGGSVIDRWHKLKGTPYTNPPNSRSMRKFMAGDIWEWIIKTVLIRAGIPYKTQERVRVEYDGLLAITGKVDFVVGGSINYQQALDRLEQEDIPDFIKTPVRAIIDDFSVKYPEGIPEKNIEVKSVSSYMFEKILKDNKPLSHHLLQATIYKLSSNRTTDILYVSRDDCRLMQFNIDHVTNEVEKLIKQDLEQITKFYRDDIEPPKEELISFNNDTFSLNWKIQYSPYLSMLYTYEVDGKEKPIESPDEYFEFFNPKVSSWNRVLKRIKEGKELTKSNLEYIDEMGRYGFEKEINTLLGKK